MVRGRECVEIEVGEVRAGVVGGEGGCRGLEWVRVSTEHVY